MATYSNGKPRLMCIEQAFRGYFSSDLSVQDAENPAQFRAQMLRSSSEDTEVDNGDEDEELVQRVTVHQVLVGVSDASYVTQLAVVIESWDQTGTNPLESLAPATTEAEHAAELTPSTLAIDGVTSEFSSRERVLNVHMDAIHTFVAAVTAGAEEEACAATASLVDRLGGARGLLTLLGFQQTVGSRTLAPLTRRQCLDAFVQRHTPGELLSVGARAFSKHCARSSSGWWGELKGNDAVKNARAELKVEELLATATWKNIHSLPHAHATMEIRNALGYGARWDAETRSFRGFLEPPMANGHEIGWCH